MPLSILVCAITKAVEALFLPAQLLDFNRCLCHLCQVSLQLDQGFLASQPSVIADTQQLLSECLCRGYRFHIQLYYFRGS
jgi:hypothetical protein